MIFYSPLFSLLLFICPTFCWSIVTNYAKEVSNKTLKMTQNKCQLENQNMGFMGQIGPNMAQNIGFMGFMGFMDFMD